MASSVASVPSVYSTSQLARSEESFKEWLWGTKIRLATAPVAGPHDTQLKTLKDSALSLPTWMANKDSPYYHSKNNMAWSTQYHPLQDRLLSEAAILHGTTFTCSDIDSQILSHSLPAILGTCADLQDLESSTLPAKELTWRMPVDELTKHVFRRVPIGEPLELRTECTIAVPSSTCVRVAVGHTAIVDTVVFLHRENFLLLGTQRLCQEASLFHIPKFNLDIPQWICEYRRTVPNAHQLCYGLGAAQFQRRALGFRDHLVFGAGCLEGKVETYASWWNNDLIIISPLHDFDLKVPFQTVQFFLFLRGVMGYTNGLAAYFGQLTLPLLVESQNYAGSWRSPKRESQRSRPDSTISEDKELEETGQGMEEVDIVSNDTQTDETVWSECEQKLLSSWRSGCTSRFWKGDHAAADHEVNLSEFSALLNL